MSVQNLLRSTCTILRPTVTRSSTNASVSLSFTSSSTLVPFDLQASTSREVMQFQKNTASTMFRCYFLPNADVRAADRILVTAGPLPVVTVEVRSLLFDTAGRANHKVVIAEDVVTGGA